MVSMNLQPISAFRRAFVNGFGFSRAYCADHFDIPFKIVGRSEHGFFLAQVTLRSPCGQSIIFLISERFVKQYCFRDMSIPSLRLSGATELLLFFSNRYELTHVVDEF